MEKKIQFLVRQWKKEDPESGSQPMGSDADDAALERELGTLWQKAGRYKTKSFEPDVEANWKKFQSTIHNTQDEKENAQIRRMVPGYWWAAASITLLLLAAWWVLNQQVNTQEFQALATNKQQIKKVTLPDQSLVWLSKNSELKFDPKLDQSKVRKVVLRGEAFFEVRPNPKQPFQIETPHGLIEVLGTSFNVRALKTETQTEVQVVSGRVALMDKTNQNLRIEIPANFIGYIPATKTQPNKVSIDNKKIFASTKVWRFRKIELSGRTLAEAQEIMRRYTDFRLEFSDPALADCIFTWTLDLDNPEASLKLLAKTGYFHLEKTSSGIFRLDGKACPK